MNPIVKRCEELAKEGWSINAVSIRLAPRGALEVSIDLNGPQLSLNEGGAKVGDKTITVDTDNLPKGVTCFAYERPPAEVMKLLGNAEQAEALIIGVATEGEARDWASFAKTRWLTKPNKWNSVLRRITGARP